MAAIKKSEIKGGEVMVLAGIGPMGTGMEETYQVTSALRRLPFGKTVALITDARFSGLSTGPCIGHAGPEALAGGPIGKVRDGDVIKIIIDTKTLEASVDLVGDGGGRFSLEEAARILSSRTTREDIRPDPRLPEDTRLWAALQQAGGGTWGGCVYDVEEIVRRLG